MELRGTPRNLDLVLQQNSDDESCLHFGDEFFGVPAVRRF